MSASLVLFNNCLRLDDHPALTAAAALGDPVVPVFLWRGDRGGEVPGAASRWWLHESLAALDAALRARGSGLVLRTGSPEEELADLVERTGAGSVFMTRGHEPGAADTEQSLRAVAAARGAETVRCGGVLLHEPETVRKSGGGAFGVFGPFWRACLARPEPRPPSPSPARLRAPAAWPATAALGDLNLLPAGHDWTGKLAAAWTPGEAQAQAALAEFLKTGLADYAHLRDRPGATATSRLSPHLHFGEVGVRRLWHAVNDAVAADPALQRGADKFLAEIGWREFSAHLLFHRPHLPERALRPEFERFAWTDDPEPAFRAWTRGQTGYPVVDAGMRQLWATGWMHNRVRMVAASFLVKHLRVDWRRGAAWFLDTLVDADLANNSASWQWVAGSGADAAPFFRIFNPVLQGEKFDPDGAYVRRWVPELTNLRGDWLQKPWQAPEAVLQEAGIRLGETYPRPVVDHGRAREAALAAYRRIAGRGARPQGRPAGGGRR